jgi:hypothetical protein
MCCALQAASSLTTPYLEYDDYTKAQAALDAAQQVRGLSHLF